MIYIFGSDQILITGNNIAKSFNFACFYFFFIISEEQPKQKVPFYPGKDQQQQQRQQHRQRQREQGQLQQPIQQQSSKINGLVFKCFNKGRYTILRPCFCLGSTNYCQVEFWV